MDSSGDEAHATLEEFLIPALEFPAPVLIVDRRGIIRALNHSCSSEFGYGLHQIMGEHVRELACGRLRAKVDGYIAKFFEAPRTRTIGRQRMLDVDGNLVDVTISLVPCPAGDCAAAFVIRLNQSGKADERWSRIKLCLGIFLLGVASEAVGSYVPGMAGIKDIGKMIIGAGAFGLLGAAGLAAPGQPSGPRPADKPT